MRLLNIFKRKQAVNYQRENYKVVKQKLGERQQEVYAAVALIGHPCTARQVARFLKWDSASVTPRLAELARKERVKVVDVKQGLDRKWRKYYTATQF